MCQLLEFGDASDPRSGHEDVGAVVSMKFTLVDRITELVPGRRICTIKSLTLSEEYLGDHFRTFPVMPGVLMLECMIQSAGWLVRATEDFAHSLVLLTGAKNVNYKSFITPGGVLRMEVDCKRMEANQSEFVGKGFCEDREMVKARIVLNHVNLADEKPALEAVDRELVAQTRAQFALIGGEPFVVPGAAPGFD